MYAVGYHVHKQTVTSTKHQFSPMLLTEDVHNGAIRAIVCSRAPTLTSWIPPYGCMPFSKSIGSCVTITGRAANVPPK